MHPSPNLQHIAQQTSEVASKCTDQRWQLAFQTVSVVSMAVLGVGTAVHLLREMPTRQKRANTTVMVIAGGANEQNTRMPKKTITIGIGCVDPGHMVTTEAEGGYPPPRSPACWKRASGTVDNRTRSVI
jgi:6-phosphogluconolactonase/glucosamine-6-phosphate isomerase/deaminase